MQTPSLLNKLNCRFPHMPFCSNIMSLKPCLRPHLQVHRGSVVEGFLGLVLHISCMVTPLWAWILSHPIWILIRTWSPKEISSNSTATSLCLPVCKAQMHNGFLGAHQGRVAEYHLCYTWYQSYFSATNDRRRYLCNLPRFQMSLFTMEVLCGSASCYLFTESRIEKWVVKVQLLALLSPTGILFRIKTPK